MKDSGDRANSANEGTLIGNAQIEDDGEGPAGSEIKKINENEWEEGIDVYL